MIIPVRICLHYYLHHHTRVHWDSITESPCWPGYGTEFTGIAGPIWSEFVWSLRFRSRGGHRPHYNSDISIASIADFELSVHNMLKDVEDLYWVSTWRIMSITVKSYREMVPCGPGGKSKPAQIRDSKAAVLMKPRRVTTILKSVYGRPKMHWLTFLRQKPLCDG